MPGCTTTAAAIYKRQHFLIRCLTSSCQNSNFLGRNLHHNTIRMQSVMSFEFSLEADAISVVRSITPHLDLSRHKGQAGCEAKTVAVDSANKDHSPDGKRSAVLYPETETQGSTSATAGTLISPLKKSKVNDN